ncbi:MAG TPA: glycosyltransferase [Candidatus Acidoferrales bacterium]|nr:glycosyltransferase [Candidatus Acidoferrales bacterium]
MRLSVVIPCLNAASTIGAQLQALAEQRWHEPWEIVVADNGSTDGSPSVVDSYRAKWPHLRLVDASACRGQPFALNAGASAALGEALVFCDADDQVGDGWLSAMGDALREHDFVACSIDFEKLNPPWLQAIFSGHAQRHGRFQKARFAPHYWHAGGGTIGVKKWLWKAVGGFSGALPYQHDTDFCFKVQLRGVEPYFVREAVVHLRCRPTLRGLMRQAANWAEYSVLLYKMYRPAGTADARLWKEFFWQWKALLGSFPRVFLDRAAQARWIWRFGWQLGRLRGSLKHRVPPV